MRTRLVLLLLVALATLLGGRGAAAEAPATRIRGEVAWLASAVVADGGAVQAYVSTAASLNVIRGRAWFLTVAVEGAPAYGGDFFVLSEIDGRLTGELMHGPGEGGTRLLTGDELARFLARVELDAAPIRAVFDRYFGGPTRARPPRR